MRFHSHREADEELTEAFENYDAAAPGLSADFLNEIEAGIERIPRQPETWPRVKGSKARRHWIRRFPYALIYLVRADEILLIAVMHAKRRPFYWAHRLD
jgi:plasmid stabilization system protein ParE